MLYSNQHGIKIIHVRNSLSSLLFFWFTVLWPRHLQGVYSLHTPLCFIDFLMMMKQMYCYISFQFYTSYLNKDREASNTEKKDVFYNSYDIFFLFCDGSRKHSIHWTPEIYKCTIRHVLLQVNSQKTATDCVTMEVKSAQDHQGRLRVCFTLRCAETARCCSVRWRKNIWIKTLPNFCDTNLQRWRWKTFFLFF